MALAWRAKRQLSSLGILAFGVLLAATAVLVLGKDAPTCADNKQNQDEADVDCGGPCTPCLGRVQKPVARWGRLFQTSQQSYDVAAQLEHQNLNAGAQSLRYRFKLYDKDNVLIAVRENETFLKPQERFLLFEPNVDTGFRVPQRATIELDPIAFRYMERVAFPIVVARQNFEQEPFGRLTALVRNTGLEPIENVIVQAVLFDAAENAIAASVTTVALVPAQREVPAVLTWPYAFQTQPARIAVFLRTR